MIAPRSRRLLTASLATQLRSLRRDQQGAAILEFALIAPVFLMLVIGTLDLGQMAYGTAVLNGAVQKAARDSALETSSTIQADNLVKSIVSPVLPGVIVSTARKSYFDFVDVGRPEKWNDANSNGTCDNHESYVDENDNGTWNSDIGESGNGGASDVIIYTVTAKYKPIFKVPFIPTSWNQRTLTAKAVRKNQPYASQQVYSAKSGICT